MNALFALLAAALTIVYPGPGAHLPPVARSFVFGASPPGSRVIVNGIAAHSAADGGWIAYVPFSSGDFAINVTAVGARIWTAYRSIYVEAPLLTTLAAPARIDHSYPALPTSHIVVRSGDDVQLAVKGSTGARVSARVGDAGSTTLAQASASVGGVYLGALRVPMSARGASMHVTYTVRSADGSSASASAIGSVTIDPSAFPRVGEVVLARTEDGVRPYGVVMRSPGNDWFSFPPPGTPLTVVGADGGYYRVSLGSSFGYIYEDTLHIGPAGTLEPSADLQNVTLEELNSAYRVVLHLSSRVTFTLAQTSARTGLKLELFHTRRSAAHMTANGPVSGVTGVDVSAGPDGAARVQITLRQHFLWGYESAWNGTNLTLWIKKPPHMQPAPAPALRGLLVVIDPGHSPDSGAIGPLGTQERAVNLAIGLRLASHLRDFGARTLLTRYDESGLGLYDRTAIAAKAHADVLISVHNNAWLDGVDPASHLGYSVYYYNRESLDLATALRAAYSRDTQLPDAGLFRDDLALCRSTEQPSVLTESAFITWPDEEQLLLSPAFDDRLGATMADGLERWAEARRASP